MRKALVLTVGTGTSPETNIVLPLKEAIREARPDRVLLLASDQSWQHAERIVAELHLDAATAQIVRLSDVDHFQKVFLEALVQLRALRTEGFAPDEIEANFTSGTKPMSAGLALTAVTFRCGRLSYIGGTRPHGVVQTGTEVLTSMQPASVLAHQRLQLALEQFKSLQFAAVDRLLPADEAVLSGDYDQRVVAGLRPLTAAYRAWDTFQHAEVNPHYHNRAVDMNLPELQPFAIARDVLRRLQQMGDSSRAKAWRDRLIEDHLADLYNNAERRRREGKLDDAVARLYRLTEMIAQRELAQTYNVNTADVQPGQLSVSEAVRDQLDGQRRQGKVQLGLQRAYELLGELGSPLAAAYQAAGGLKDKLGLRNTSILAHGQQPIAERDATTLFELVHDLARQAVPDFEQRCDALQFPWLSTSKQASA